MRIKVTQDHIDQGERNNSEGCPVFLALHDVFGDRVSSVNGESACIDGAEINLPAKVFDFVRRFDRKKDVIPFEFELEVLDFRD